MEYKATMSYEEFPFDKFWDSYPRKVGKKKARQLWNRMNDTDRKCALWGLLLWKQTAQWNENDGKYIPYGSTFLSQERWADEPWKDAFLEAPKILQSN